MPGPPRPASLYDLTIPIHGEPEDGAGQWAAGIAKRLSVRSLIQNDATRLTGIELEFPIDPDIEGYLVIGTATLSYAAGNVTFADFSLRINGAALIPAAQTFPKPAIPALLANPSEAKPATVVEPASSSALPMERLTSATFP